VGESNGKLHLKTCPGCSVPEPYRSPDWAPVPAQIGPRAEYQLTENEDRSKICYSIYLGFCIFDSNKNRLNYTAVPVLFQIVLTTAEAVSVSSDMLVHPLLLSFPVTCYQPTCYDCSHRAIIFQFVAPKILLQRWKQMINARRRILLISPQ
jgi:hypothetical protein